jgi:hypothetical protein
MLLSLYGSAEPAAPVAHLLARASREPLVSRDDTQPLTALRDDDKLHVAGPAMAAAALDAVLAELGLARNCRLKQLHLMIDHAAEIAHDVRSELAREGFGLREIKAPRGEVSWREDGKVLIRPRGGEWTQSSRELNVYTGPDVQPKHR